MHCSVVLSREAKSKHEMRESGEKWLWSICRNQVIDHLRRQKTSALPDEELLIVEFDPDAQLVDQERLRALASGWATLAECEQEELRRGRGRGPGRKAWHAAIASLRSLCLFEE